MDEFDYRWLYVPHQTPEPDLRPNWQWVQLWEQENPAPPKTDDDRRDWDHWYRQYRKMCDHVWVAACLPDFRVWDWPESSVKRARRLVAGHVCSVCGRKDDPGCTVGC